MDLNGDGRFDGMDMAYIESGGSGGDGGYSGGSGGGCTGCLAGIVAAACCIVLFFFCVSCVAGCMVG